MTEENTAEQTQPIVINPEEALASKIPDWLLEYAASQPTVVETSDSETEEDAILVVLESSEWHAVKAELDEAIPDTDVTLDDLLKTGHFTLAAELLREQANDLASIKEAQQKIRPALMLNEELSPLWDLYDELTIKLNQLKQNSANNGG